LKLHQHWLGAQPVPLLSADVTMSNTDLDESSMILKSRQLIPTILLIVAVVFFNFAPALSQTTPQKQKKTIFIFHTNEFWLNLHHFLYVLARAENKERDASREAVSDAPADEERGLAKLDSKEQETWHKAVAWYAAGPARKDLVFDDPLPTITNALVSEGDAKSLARSKVDPAFVSIMESVGPIYRKAWWTQHQDANRKWEKMTQELVDRHGSAVLAFITNAYKLPWPATGFHVHVSGYSNWAGAYSTTGNLLVLSSQNPSVQGAYGLETIFHEGMHQWDDQVTEALRAEAIKLNKRFPQGLRHSLVFFTAGEAVRRVIRDHIPYADKFGVWGRGMQQFKAPLEQAWKPYLDGHGTREEAFDELIKLTAVAPPK